MPSLPSTPITDTPASQFPFISRSTQTSPSPQTPPSALALNIGRLTSLQGLSTPNAFSSPAPSSSPAEILSQMRFSYTSPRTSSDSRSRSRSRTRISPDRFIPTRTNLHSFRMSSPAHLLSSEERLLRRSTRSPSRGRSLSPDRRTASTATNNSRNRGASPVTFHGQMNRRISAGAVGVFGIGVGAVGRREEPRDRGREVNVNVFGDKDSPEAEMERHERRLSAALGVDRSAKVFSFTRENDRSREWSGKKGGVMGTPGSEKASDMLWEDFMEAGRDSNSQASPTRKPHKRTVPTTPFRVLDAPGLRDDYYCSLIAYSPFSHSLAVGLHSDVYSWTEAGGARPFEAWSTSHVTSLAFSSLHGANNILAVGRIDGSLSLWNPSEPAPRIEQTHGAGVACLAWKPVLSSRPSSAASSHGSSRTNDRSHPLPTVETEGLLVGDEMGSVYYYSIEWNNLHDGHQSGSADATIKLLRRIVVHTQQICGLAWNSDGEQFATGGNDNVACLFDTNEVLLRRNGNSPEERPLEGGEKYRWPHGAAVKAIAFCPWQRSLLATGGGSNDRCIHFFHTFSGATLATINVSAQVTSLLWSQSHREIAATFGYANPDHAVRIAVFSWPECRQIVQVPWQEDMRALYAVAYPGGPGDGGGATSRSTMDEIDEDAESVIREDANGPSTGAAGASRGGRAMGSRGSAGRKMNRGRSEGCIVVAASDETVRFHEVWSETRRGVLGWRGVLGGSDILEGLEGIEKDGGEMIR